MKRKLLILLTAAALICFYSPAFAGQGGARGGCGYKGPKPIGQINMTNGGVYARGKMGIILKTRYFKKDDIYSGSGSIADYTGKPAGTGPREQERLVTQLTLRYGLFDNMDVRLMLPYWQKDMVRGMMKSGTLTNVDSSNDGFGDMVLMGRYKILSQKKGGLFNLALGAGVKMPSGDSDDPDDSKKDESCFGMGFQCGTGSWDPKFEIAANRMIRNWRIDATIMATFPSEGDREYEYGNCFQYNLGSSVALNDWFDLQLEYNGIWKDKSEDHGAAVENSGGHWGYITPGVHFKLKKQPNVHLDFGVPILVLRDLNGEQLSEKYQFVAKLAVKF
ncbi:MAG: transporter [Desulfobacter sp.]|nr:MAG: transporter [Desulfobacter sp.]